MSEKNQFVKDLFSVDRSAFNLAIGIRAAIFAIAPLTVSVVFHYPLLVFSTIGALFLTNTEGQPSRLPLRVLLVASFTEAVSLGLGTLAATTGFFSPVLIGLAVSISLFVGGSPKWATTGMFTAITFAVGAGLPGASVEAAGLRFLFSLLGTLLAFAGVALHRLYLSRRHRMVNWRSPLAQPISRSEALRSATLLGVVSAVGFAIGHALGFPRDFWVVVTIVILVRPTLRSTESFTWMMAVGTIVGAFIAAAITLETSSAYTLLPLLFSVAVLMFSSRGVNFALVQALFTPYIIILVNILYPGEWYVAFYRIFEVAIGIGLALLAVYLISVMKKKRGE